LVLRLNGLLVHWPEVATAAWLAPLIQCRPQGISNNPYISTNQGKNRHEWRFG
jgi:hypothetical protein